MRIGIVGCGTAGPAAAAMLHDLGHEVAIYERASDLRPIGAGLLLQPTGQAVLARLGVLDRVRALAAPIAELHGVNTLGWTVLRARYADLDPGIVGLGVHRGALFAALEARVRSAGIPIRTGFEAAAYEVAADGRVALRAGSGEEAGPFDLLIVADGSRSLLRAQSGLVRKCAQYPWGALWFVGEDPDGSFGDTLFQVYRGTSGMIGFLPSGRASESGPRMVSMFWEHPPAGHRPREAGGPGRVREAGDPSVPEGRTAPDTSTVDG